MISTGRKYKKLIQKRKQQCTKPSETLESQTHHLEVASREQEESCFDSSAAVALAAESQALRVGLFMAVLKLECDQV